MRFKDHSVAPVLVGLTRIGIVGLHEALKMADESPLQDRERLVDLIMEHLAARNYIPDLQVQAYRIAVWREYLRYKRQEFSAFFSEVSVTVRGPAGRERDEFVELVRSVLAGLELRPVVTYADESEAAKRPELLIRGEMVARSPQSQGNLEKAVRQSFAAW